MFQITRRFLLAGHAIFTISGPNGGHYTFKIFSPKGGEDDTNGPRFLSLLTGPDNEQDYTYVGIVSRQNGVIIPTKASRWRRDNPPVYVKILENNFLWYLWRGQSPPQGYAINGNGRCGRCGRTLTRPEGVDERGYRFGFGPVCWDKMLATP